MVNSEIVVELPGGVEITSIITKNSAEHMGLKEGSEVYAVIKATSVMLASDWQVSLTYRHSLNMIKQNVTKKTDMNSIFLEVVCK